VHALISDLQRDVCARPPRPPWRTRRIHRTESLAADLALEWRRAPPSSPYRGEAGARVDPGPQDRRPAVHQVFRLYRSGRVRPWRDRGQAQGEVIPSRTSAPRTRARQALSLSARSRAARAPRPRIARHGDVQRPVAVVEQIAVAGHRVLDGAGNGFFRRQAVVDPQRVHSGGDRSSPDQSWWLLVEAQQIAPPWK